MRYTKENESNVFDLIDNQLAKISESYQTITGRDFNSRIGTKPEFIVEDRKDLDFLSDGYKLDTFTTHRNKEDVSINNYGEQLIQFCIRSKLRILNARTRGIYKDISSALNIRGFWLQKIVSKQT